MWARFSLTQLVHEESLFQNLFCFLVSSNGLCYEAN